MRQNLSLLLPVLGPLASATAVSRQSVPALLPRQAGNGICQATQPTVAAPHENIWAGLTNQEMADALDFLYNSKELNLTRDGGSWDNTLLSIDLLQPNKTDVLRFLAGGGAAPLRYARANLAFGASKEPYIREYIVGPMAKGNQTQARPLTFLSTRNPDKKLRVYDSEFDDSLSNSIMSQAADITKALWNMDVNELSLTTVSPTGVDNGQVTTWQGFVGRSTGSFDTDTLLPQGLYVKSDRTGRQGGH